jgi:hypothetical protein
VENDTSSVADPATLRVACTLCGVEIPKATVKWVNGRPACSECVNRVRSELAAQAPTPAAFPLAIVGGTVGALAGAAVWVGIAVAANVEVGWIAVLVGWLAGQGVKLGANGKRGMPLQVLACILAVVGMFAAKYGIFAHEWVKQMGGSYFSSAALSVFPDILPKMITAFDALFAVLAVMAAFRVPKATPVSIVES